MIEKYRHPLRFYFYSALIPWSFWLLAAYMSHQANASDHMVVISVLGLAGLCGPMLIAGFLLLKDKALLADVTGRWFNFRASKPVYFMIAIGLMPTSIIVAMAISLLFGHSINQFVISGHATFSSGVFPVWFILVIAPVLEEVAWHSYGTDCLRQKFNVFYTSILFAIYWALWHVPLALIKGYYHSHLVVEGVIYGINFLISIFPFVLLMNWLYYKTNRNILVAVALHLTANVFNEIFATHPDSKIIQTVLLTLLVIYLIIKDRTFFFNQEFTPGLTEVDSKDNNHVSRLV